MSTLHHTRRLVEHRYARPLDQLQREAVRGGSGDPVLPIVLRRLDDLARTAEQTRAARRALHTASREARTQTTTRVGRLRPCVADLIDLEQQEQSHAEAVWDLLDVRLLLDQSGTGRTAIPRRVPLAEDEDLLSAARQAAAGLPRLTRDALRLALHGYGIHISNHRLGTLLQQLRTERLR